MSDTLQMSVVLRGGKLVALDAGGHEILSALRAGEGASLNEAVEILAGRFPDARGELVQDAPDQAVIGGRKTITRAAFDRMSRDDKHEAMLGRKVLVVD